MELLTVQEISKIMNVSIRTATRYNKDIKKHYNLDTKKTKITKNHLIDYFNVPNCAN